MKNFEEFYEKECKLLEKLAEKKLCRTTRPDIDYIQYLFDEMEWPMRSNATIYDEKKYIETGFFIVSDVPKSTILEKSNFFFASEDGNLILHSPSLEKSRVIINWYGVLETPMRIIMRNLTNDLSYYIAKNPNEASKIPAKAFNAIPSLDKKILECYKQIKLKELASLDQDKTTDFVKNIREESLMLNKIFDQKEKELTGEKLDSKLFARTKNM